MKRLLLTCLLLAAFVGDAAAARPKLPSKYRWYTPSYRQRGALRQIRYDDPMDLRIGFADTTGRVVIAPRYEKVTAFYAGRAVVSEKRADKQELWGMIDTTGREVVPCVWTDLWTPCDGLVRAQRGKGEEARFGYLDLEGREAIPVRYTEATDFRNGEAAVRLEEGLAGWIDRTGKPLRPFVHNRVRRFYNGLAVVGIEGKYYMKYGVVDRAGNERIPMRYYSFNGFSEGRAVVSRIIGGKPQYGQVDTLGREVVPLEWDYVSSYSDGMYWVGKGEYPNCIYRLLDGTGKPVHDYLFYDLNDSGSHGHVSAAIRLPDGTLRYGVLGRRGKVVLPFRYEQVTIFTERQEDGTEADRVSAVFEGETVSYQLLFTKEP